MHDDNESPSKILRPTSATVGFNFGDNLIQSSCPVTWLQPLPLMVRQTWFLSSHSCYVMCVGLSDFSPSNCETTVEETLVFIPCKPPYLKQTSAVV